MQAEFWHNCWKNNQIGFHELEANPFLVKHLSALSLKPVSRIFLPLCGKTSSIPWLLSLGYQVVGAELSEIAVVNLFEDINVDPDITQCGSLHRYSADGVAIFVGDIFDLDADTLGQVDAIFDRGALVALPEGMRADYARHLRSITLCSKQLLICYEYVCGLMQGPPFSISDNELEIHYESAYKLTLLESADANFGDESISVTEKAWLLERR